MILSKLRSREAVLDRRAAHRSRSYASDMVVDTELIAGVWISWAKVERSSDGEIVRRQTGVTGCSRTKVERLKDDGGGPGLSVVMPRL